MSAPCQAVISSLWLMVWAMSSRPFSRACWRRASILKGMIRPVGDTTWQFSRSTVMRALPGEGLANLKPLTALTDLNLRSMKITDAGLTNLKGLTALQDLSLHGTLVTDAGMTNLKGLTALQHLDLGDTQVSEAAADNLQKLLPNLVVDR